MSAIGGIINLEGKRICPDIVMDMSRAMLGRAREQRGAYLTECAALLHNRALQGEPETARQPRTVTRDGKRFTVVLDGCPSGVGMLAGMGRELGLESAAELVLDCYLAFGVSFVESLSGAFALAIYDEKTGELFCARDREGRCPLFYTVEDGTLAFASEIKALLRFLPGAAQIDGTALRAHLRAPCGVYGGEMLYREISALPPGHYGVYSRMGMTVCPYGTEHVVPEPPSRGGVITPSVICPSAGELKRLLCRLVFAFDYPQFDHLMPGFLLAIEEGAEKKRSVAVEDGTLYMDIGYAQERADRLGAMLGISLTAVPPLTISTRQRELKRLDRLLRELLEQADGSLLVRLFGADWRETVSGEKNLAKRIRMQGILYQTGVWLEHYRLAVV